MLKLFGLFSAERRALKRRLISKLTVSLKRYPDTKPEFFGNPGVVTGDPAWNANRGERYLAVNCGLAARRRRN